MSLLDGRAFPINARLMRPEEVAETFVLPSRIFSEVSSQNHVVVLGPRGSGKTTLLSMLTQPAQRVWRGRAGNAGEPPLSYIGVLVRADLTWSRQLRHLGRRLEHDQRATVVRAAYVNQCLLALVRYTRDVVQFSSQRNTSVGYREKVERAIIGGIAPATGLSASSLSLSECKNELLGRSASMWRSIGQPPDPVDPVLRIDLFAAAAAFAEALEGVDLGSSVALLFDELELVPWDVREYLRTGLRDADSRVILKMSVSPVEGAVEALLGGHEASGGQDFIPVDLTYPQKTAGYEFTAALLVDLAGRRGLKLESVEDLLGPSRFDLASDAGSKKRSYRTRGSLSSAFADLASEDLSFADYLKAAEIDPSSIDALDGGLRAASVRKIRDVVLVRQRYRREVAAGHNRRRRGSKSYEFYAGRDSVLALLEGNPRWVVNFMSSLLAGAPDVLPIRPTRQGLAIGDVIASVRSRVQNSPVPVDASVDADPTRGQRILALLDNIGSYFRSRLLAGPFDPDPPLTFVVDDDVDADTVSLISDAVSNGAVIHVPKRDSADVFIRAAGERFRLSYLLASTYQLPPILGRQINLTSILAARLDDVEDVTTELRLFR